MPALGVRRDDFTGPNHDPNHDPTHDQTHDPTHDQTHDPTHDQTHDPTHDQTHDETHDQIHDQIHDEHPESMMSGTRFKTDQIRWQRRGHSRPRGLVVLLVVLALVAFAATAAVLLDTLAAGPGGRSAVEVEPGREPGAGAGADTGTGGGGVEGTGVGLVALPVGGDTVDGYPVGFGRDELGAAAVPVELNRSQIGFDYAAAVDVARLYAAPGDEAALAARARAAVTSRRRALGVNVLGAVRTPASFALSPYAYALITMPAETSTSSTRSAGSGNGGTDTSGVAGGAQRYVVSVLSVASLTDASGRVSQRYYTGTQLTAWSEEVDDWKVLEPTRAEAAQLERMEVSGATPSAIVAPGRLRDLRDAGWTPIATSINEQAMGR